MKNWKSFLAGTLAVVPMVLALAVTMTGTAFAAAGKLEAGTAGVVILDKVKVEPGAAYQAEDGSIPAVVTYRDASGKTHNYLPVEMLTDFLNIPSSWSEKRNSVVLGVTMEGAELESRIYRPGERPQNPASPTLGKTVGPFTEVAPGTVDTKAAPTGIDEDGTRVQTVTGFTTGGTYIPENGKHIVLTVTNNGQTAVSCLVGRDRVLGSFEKFPTADIAPGKTLTRAFAIAEGTTEEQAGFTCILRGANPADAADVSVSLKQYQ